MEYEAHGPTTNRTNGEERLTKDYKSKHVILGITQKLQMEMHGVKTERCMATMFGAMTVASMQNTTRVLNFISSKEQQDTLKECI